MNLQFPADFVSFFVQYAGSDNPLECEFDVICADGDISGGNFGVLLPIFGDDSEEGIVDALSDLGDQLPSGVLPIIGSGSGDYVCLDFRSGGTASIIYFFHEKSGDDSLVPISRTFSEFLDILREPEDDFNCERYDVVNLCIDPVESAQLVK